MRTTPWILAASVAIGLGGLTAAALADGGKSDPKAQAAPTYDGQVKPLFDRNGCLECHTPQKLRKSKVDLTTYETALKAVTKSDLEKSKIITMIRNGKMPPKKSGKKVSEQDLAVLKAWVAAGAPEK